MMERDAMISGDGLYRYLLTRDWDRELPKLGFIMLNPSTADGREDDPTIRRCLGFARSWGFGSIAVGNLFALRATKPIELTKAEYPIGPVNETWIDAVVRESELVIAAWGSHPFAAVRAKHVGKRLADQLSCLGVTKAGHPKHPLYLRADTQPIPFDPEGIK